MAEIKYEILRGPSALWASPPNATMETWDAYSTVRSSDLGETRRSVFALSVGEHSLLRGRTPDGEPCGLGAKGR